MNRKKNILYVLGITDICCILLLVLHSYVQVLLEKIYILMMYEFIIIPLFIFSTVCFIFIIGKKFLIKKIEFKIPTKVFVTISVIGLCIYLFALAIYFMEINYTLLMFFSQNKIYFAFLGSIFSMSYFDTI